LSTGGLEGGRSLIRKRKATHFPGRKTKSLGVLGRGELGGRGVKSSGFHNGQM